MVDKIISRVQEILPATMSGTVPTDNVQSQINQMANSALAQANVANNAMPQLVQQMQQMQTLMLQMQQQMTNNGP